MAIKKGGIIVIGSYEESIPKKCEYCGRVAELRPYGKDGAFICFDCGTKPENKETTEKMFTDLLNSAPSINPNDN